MTSDPKPKARSNCYYRTKILLHIRTTGQWFPEGVIVDLSDVSDQGIRECLQMGYIETADPSEDEPIYNTPLGTVVKRTPCPCGR